MFPQLIEELRKQNSRDWQDFKRLEKSGRSFHPVEMKFNMLLPCKRSCHLQSKTIINMLFYYFQICVYIYICFLKTNNKWMCRMYAICIMLQCKGVVHVSYKFAYKRAALTWWCLWIKPLQACVLYISDQTHLFLV